MPRRKKLRRANGEGSVFYVPGRGWRSYITNPTSVGPKRKYFSGDTREEAHTKMVAALANPSSVFLPYDLAKLTVEQYLHSWLDSMKLTVREGTYRGYSQIVRVHLVPNLGGITLKQLGAAHIREMKTALLGKGLNPSTVARIQAVLSQSLRQAVDDELILKNPATAVKKPKVPRSGSMRILQYDEAMRLIEAVRGTRDEAFFVTALRTGMRKGELLGLKWKDVGKSEIHIRRSVRTEHGGEMWGPPKNGEARQIKIGPNQALTLSKHASMQREERLASKVWIDKDLVFPGSQGQVRRHRSVYDCLNTSLEAASLPSIRFHDLRHTAVSLMLRQGMDILEVAEVVGHKDPSLTWRVYSHILEDSREAAAAKMDVLLS